MTRLVLDTSAHSHFKRNDEAVVSIITRARARDLIVLRTLE